jgi:REP element-mobilizing transposase RayT
MQVIKQSFARKLMRLSKSPPIESRDGWGSLSSDQHHIWQPRFYDFPVFTQGKKVEKLRYMHRNPVKRELVAEPQDWRWSSFRYYAYSEAGPVVVNEQARAEMKIRQVSG